MIIEENKEEIEYSGKILISDLTFIIYEECELIFDSNFLELLCIRDHLGKYGEIDYELLYSLA